MRTDLPQFHQQKANAVVILPIGTVNHGLNDQSQCVDGNMTLATPDFLATVVTPFDSSFGSSDGLIVDDGHCGLRFPVGGSSKLLSQRPVDLFPDSGADPLSVDSVDGTPVREVVVKHSPLTPGSDDILDGIDDPPTSDARTPVARGFRDESADQLPLPIREIAGILSLHHACGSFLVGTTAFSSLYETASISITA